MKTKILSGVFFFCFVMLMASCSSSKGKNDGSSSNLTVKQWSLLNVKSVDEAQLLVPPLDKAPTLTISKDGQASGFAGCNRFSGPVTVKGSSLKFGNLVLTRMMCMESMDIESATVKALSEVDNYTIENGNLYLKKGSDILATYSVSK